MEQNLDFHLLNDYQHGFPLNRAPYADIAAQLRVSEHLVLERFEALRRNGMMSRVGAVFAPKRIGHSTLAAMAVPPARLVQVAETINRFPEVNHNYAREHRYNLWFVVTAASAERLRAVLDAISAATGHPLLDLPLLEEFHIDLGFSLVRASGTRSVNARTLAQPRQLDDTERRLVAALQEGLPIFIRPFQLIAERINASESDVLQRIRHWREEGIIKRFGVVVRHRELGYTANAMWVQNLPDTEVSERATALASASEITLCYRRPRVPPEWPYNLFCMIHGHSRDAVLANISTLRERHGLQGYAHDILFSTTRFKQTGARYA